MKEDEEIRCWFRVSSNRKKIWNIGLWLLEELKKICKKHNIKYFASWGTMLWSIRHNWFIPWDDDIDILMFREDYEKFINIAEKEFPTYIKIWKHPWWFSQVMNINTAALYLNNWWDKDFIWGIRLDIFPIDYASKFKFINWMKHQILRCLCVIMSSQKSYWAIDKLEKWKKLLIYPFKSIFEKINFSKVYQLHERISRKTLFKWENVWSVWFPYRFFPKKIFDKSHDVKFENTTINIPNWYDVYLKIAYGDYMKPVIFQWWHDCWYSADKSYKDIIKWFNKSKSNEYNYSNCKSLFIL